VPLRLYPGPFSTLVYSVQSSCPAVARPGGPAGAPLALSDGQLCRRSPFVPRSLMGAVLAWLACGWCPPGALRRQVEPPFSPHCLLPGWLGASLLSIPGGFCPRGPCALPLWGAPAFSPRCARTACPCTVLLSVPLCCVPLCFPRRLPLYGPRRCAPALCLCDAPLRSTLAFASAVGPTGVTRRCAPAFDPAVCPGVVPCGMPPAMCPYVEAPVSPRGGRVPLVIALGPFLLIKFIV
jgi:hypothetical protein